MAVFDDIFVIPKVAREGSGLTTLCFRTLKDFNIFENVCVLTV